ncbi:glycosyltransferase [Flaviramulus aquimarinus]
MKKKTKIIFILPSLASGGAERVISFVSQNINKEIFEPILLIAGYQSETAYDIKSIKINYLNKSKVRFAIPSIILFLIKHRADIVLSSISHTNEAMSLISPLFRKTKFIGREATILSHRKKERNKKKWSPFSFVLKRLKDFKRLDMIICQSRDMAEDMIKNYQVPKHRTCIINNPISSLPPVKSSRVITETKKFITVGRLTQIKGHLRILEMLSKLKTPFLYTIIGDGNYKDVIFEKAKKLSLLKYIKHIPFTTNVNDYLAENDMFLQGSYVEGFPNALLESCVIGTPVIAFNVPGGTKEIIENGINGFLVDDETTYINMMEDVREWEPDEIRQSVYLKFNKEKIIEQYEKLFIDILKK